MSLFYREKNICFRIHVSSGNQERMKCYADDAFVPLLALKCKQYYTVNFAYKEFTCSSQSKKQVFSYKDISKIETHTDGLLLYLNNGTYLSVATEKSEKHNTALYDIVAFLKRRCHRVFDGRIDISYPDKEDCRYKTNQLPAAQISFTLSEGELRRMLWYDYLFEERMLIFLIVICISLLTAVIVQNLWLVLLASIVILMAAILTGMLLKDGKGYKNNHQGQLYALLYEDILVIRLRDTDLELEYDSMKPMKSILGLWRMQSGDFFVLTLPKRIENENALFFQLLYQKINKN